MHLDALLFISNQLFGQDYYSADDFIEINNSSIFRVVQKDAEIVGFFIFKIFTEQSVDYIVGGTASELLEVKTIAVHPSFQGHGIGTIIFNEVQQIAQANGVHNCYCIAWKRNGKVAMHNIHINAGFDVIREIENYWKLDSLEKEYDCPECGNPCECSAVIYNKSC